MTRTVRGVGLLLATLLFGTLVAAAPAQADVTETAKANTAAEMAQFTASALVSTQYMTLANGRCGHIPVYGYAMPDGSVYNDYAAGGTLTQPRVIVNNTPNGIVFHLGQRATRTSPWVNWGDAIWLHPYTSYQLSTAAFPYKDHELWVVNFYKNAHSGEKIAYCHGYSV